MAKCSTWQITEASDYKGRVDRFDCHELNAECIHSTDTVCPKTRLSCQVSSHATAIKPSSSIWME
jgi:hypothetical protein